MSLVCLKIHICLIKRTHFTLNAIQKVFSKSLSLKQSSNVFQFWAFNNLARNMQHNNKHTEHTKIQSKACTGLKIFWKPKC